MAVRRVLFALLFVGCISDSEVEGALGEYCAVNEGKACQASSQCCPGFACVASACKRATAGTCLFAADAGRGPQQGGESCGCSNDCSSGACSDSSCR